MTPLAWCVVGAAVAALAMLLGPAQKPVSRIETVLVAVFGAFIGGDFVAAYTLGADAPLGAATLGLGIAGAVTMLVMLSVMRRAVGPMRPHKVRKKPRY